MFVYRRYHFEQNQLIYELLRDTDYDKLSFVDINDTPSLLETFDLEITPSCYLIKQGIYY